MSEIYVAPTGLMGLGNIISQGVALGYNTLPFQGKLNLLYLGASFQLLFDPVADFRQNPLFALVCFVDQHQPEDELADVKERGETAEDDGAGEDYLDDGDGAEQNHGLEGVKFDFPVFFEKQK